MGIIDKKLKDFKNKILDYNYIKFSEPQVWGKIEFSFELSIL